MVKVLWLSRHEMTDIQKEDLERVLMEDIHVTTRNVTWAASYDAASDLAENKATWRKLEEEGFKLIAGVFPPVAITAYQHVSVTCEEGTPIWNPRVFLWSPVSKQDKTIREDGSAQIEFHHLRWTTLS